MKIYKLTYAYDAFMDGRMADAVHLFSTLDKAFEFAELEYGKKREDFKECRDGIYFAANVGKWDSEEWCISEELLDKDLENIKSRK